MNWFPWQPKPWLLWMSCSCFIYYYKEFCVLTLSLQSLICVWEVGQEPNWRSSLRCLNTYRFKFLDFMCMEDEWGIIISQLSIPYLSLRLWEWESLHRLIHCRISYPSVFCWIISAFYITSVILISMFAMVSTFYNTFAFFIYAFDEPQILPKFFLDCCTCIWSTMILPTISLWHTNVFNEPITSDIYYCILVFLMNPLLTKSIIVYLHF